MLDQYATDSNVSVRRRLYQRYSTNSQHWYPWLFGQLEPVLADTAVLDVGCGNAAFWRVNAERLSPRLTVTLVQKRSPP